MGDFINEAEEKLNQELDTLGQTMLTMMQQANPDLNMQSLKKIDDDDGMSEPSVLFLGTVSMKPT